MTRRTHAALAALILALATLAVPAAPASAAARVTVANENGEAKADTTYSTSVTVTGSGFQAVQGAFGGVYVFFGTVSGTWRPSKGGRSGVDFRYVPDSEAKDNAGFQRYVAFPGSSTAAEAHDVMGADGSWSVTLTIPGPTFQTVGRSGGTETVDCRKVTCGVITVGAHGVLNPTNETFTPVTFEDLHSSTPAAQDEEQEGTKGEDGAAGDADGADLEPELDVDRATAVVGRVMAFTALGFAPGEQVVVSLGAGLAGVGPLVAGAQGEVAGVLQLPADLKAGTHTLVARGAGSGARAELSLQVAAAPAAPVVPAQDETDGVPRWEWVALGAAALVLLLVVGAGIVGRLRGREGR